MDDLPPGYIKDPISLVVRKSRVDPIYSRAAAQLIDYPAMGSEAKLSVPTPDHYLPLLYVLGSRRKGEGVSFPVEGFDGGSMTMLAIQISG